MSKPEPKIVTIWAAELVHDSYSPESGWKMGVEVKSVEARETDRFYLAVGRTGLAFGCRSRIEKASVDLTPADAVQRLHARCERIVEAARRALARAEKELALVRNYRPGLTCANSEAGVKS